MPRSRKIMITLVVLVAVTIGFLLTHLEDLRVARQLAVARRALKDRDGDKALSAAREAVRLSPRQGEAHFTLARAFRRQGQLDKVRESLEHAAKLGVPPDRIRREEWLALAQAGQMKEAQPHLSELLINPGDDGPDICEAYANGFFLTYRLDAAEQILDAWEKDFPQDPQPHVFRASMNSKMHNWPTTISHLRKAI